MRIRIEVGQVLRVAPPAGTAARLGRRIHGRAAGAVPQAAMRRPTPRPRGRQPFRSIWPAQGEVIRSFDGKTSKGIDIGNVPGTKVVAAAGGTVVYAGNGLRGYGNMLIVKHDSEYLTAYAHNRALLVKEGQSVAQGQQIAEMGDTDTNRVMLHFELRYLGPLDRSVALSAAALAHIEMTRKDLMKTMNRAALLAATTALLTAFAALGGCASSSTMTYLPIGRYRLRHQLQRWRCQHKLGRVLQKGRRDVRRVRLRRRIEGHRQRRDGGRHRRRDIWCEHQEPLDGDSLQAMTAT